jgi:pimeloyl-ACP methyl ester carboxylesterase
MAADTATAIRSTFDGGRVDAVMGLSMGGLIAQYVAADHPGIAGRYLLVSTGYRVPADILELDRRFAEHLAAGRNARAYSTIALYLAAPGLKRAALRMGFFLFGLLATEGHHPDFAADVLNEAEAEARHDARDALGRISDQVLVIGGDSDMAFPPSIQTETAGLISGAKLILYPRRGHMDVASHPRFPADVRSFLGLA